RRWTRTEGKGTESRPRRNDRNFRSPDLRNSRPASGGSHRSLADAEHLFLSGSARIGNRFSARGPAQIVCAASALSSRTSTKTKRRSNFPPACSLQQSAQARTPNFRRAGNSLEQPEQR